MELDKENGAMYAAPTGKPTGVDVTGFLQHLHGDIMGVAGASSVIFWLVTGLVLERVIYYILAIIIGLTA